LEAEPFETPLWDDAFIKTKKINNDEGVISLCADDDGKISKWAASLKNFHECAVTGKL